MRAASRALPTRPRRVDVPLVLFSICCALFAPALDAQGSPAPIAAMADSGIVARGRLAERNKLVVERVFREAWADTNFRVADELFAPGYVRHDGSASVEESSGAPSQGEIARAVRESNSTFDFRIDRLIAEGDYVVVRWTIRAEPKGNMGLLKRIFGTRGPVEFVGVNVARVQDGRIAEIWNHRDDLAFVRQLGMAPFLATAGFAGGLLVATICSWLLARLRRRRTASVLLPHPA